MSGGDGSDADASALTSIHQVAHAAIAEFLQRHGYQSTLTSFQQEAADLGWTWTAGDKQHADGATMSLETLIEAQRSQEAAQRARHALSKHARAVLQSPTQLRLAGPDTLAFAVQSVFPNLHPSNILSLSVVQLPRRFFSTSEARYVNETRTVLCSTGADKNVVLCDPATGDMVECFDGGTGAREQIAHGAAVLCTAQNPNPAHRREFVSCGMDSKVIVWDLLHAKPIQLLSAHTRFVVRCAFSPAGDYLATCSYDRMICIFKRTGQSQASERDDDDDMPPLLDTRFELVHTITTRHNPECIVFVRAAASPSPGDPGTEPSMLYDSTALAQTDRRHDEATNDAQQAKRTWLAYTMRSDCCVHYVALPLDADQALVSQYSQGTAMDGLTSKLDTLNVSSAAPPTPDWTDLMFNTNATRTDLHVSYSLLHMTLHPLGNHLAIQTGDHSIPTTGYAPPSSSLSRILILPLLSSDRTTTIWTGVSSSGFAANRHAWLPDGSAAWLTSEDGVLRLVDTLGKTRATVQAHGAAAAAADADGAAAGEEQHAMRTASSWSRGGNTVVKDVVVLDAQGTVASCGFDHTVRITSPRRMPQ